MSINIKELTDRKTSEVFPNVLLRKPNENVPVVVRSLEKGDMQLIVEYKGERKVVANISQSALNIDKLLRTTDGICYRVSPTEEYEIDNISTYLSCLV